MSSPAESVGEEQHKTQKTAQTNTNLKKQHKTQKTAQTNTNLKKQHKNNKVENYDDGKGFLCFGLACFC